MEYEPTSSEDPEYVQRKYQELIDSAKADPEIQEHALLIMTKTQEYLHHYIGRYEKKEASLSSAPSPRQRALISGMQADPELREILTMTGVKAIIAALSAIVGDLETAKRAVQ